MVQITHIVNAAVGEPENNAPVRGHGYSPITTVFARKGMESKSRKINVFNALGRIQREENIFELFDVLRRKFARFAKLEKR